MTILSKIIAGTMNWGMWDKTLSTSEMITMMQVCIESNITTFDHADIYGGYTTEAEFGVAFNQSGIDRSKIQLITKCGIQHITGNRPNKVKHYDYSKQYILWSVENSLKNLHTDYVDVLLLHRPSPLMQSEEIADAVAILKKQGKIRDFGLSNFTPMQTDLIQKHTKVDFNQIAFSATNYSPMLDGSLDHMQLHDIRPMAWNPLGSYFREVSDQTRRLTILLSDLAQKYNSIPETILLAWVLRHPADVIPVAGTVNVDRIRQLMKATEITLETEDWFAIWSESMGDKVP